MSKPHFVKAYTRDFSYISEEAWYFGQSNKLESLLGMKNPFYPANIFYMNDGVIEVWENSEALNWIQNRILEKNNADEVFLNNSIESYKRIVEKLEKNWNGKKLESATELNNFIECVFEAVVFFVIFYHTAIDERTPVSLRKKALDLRNKDVSFENNDGVIRKTLVSLYPHILGYETAVTSSEVFNPPAIGVLKEYSKSSVLIPGVVFQNISLDNFAKNHPEFIFEFDKIVEGKNIKGQIAHKGKVQGVVRIIRKKDFISLVKEGEILVSPMTTPDYLPAMKKASAFVTDEGGITSHAAIAARELKKPCIIGTKIATQVLKDGDIVEVDADRGIVTIL